MKTYKCEDCPVRSKAANYLSIAELEVLGENCVEAQFEPGETIFKQNALSSNIIYLKEGLVKITLKGPYRDQILKVVKAPQYLGIPTTMGDKINNYSAVAISKVSACFIDLKTFQKMIYRNGEFANEIIITLCKNELYQFKRCVNISQKNLYGRVADALLDLTTNIYQSSDFYMHLNRSDLADIIGTSRESVSRILSDFTKSGIIKVSGKKFTILDQEKLEHISRSG